MPRLQFRRRSGSDTQWMALLAAGAVAGLAIGLMVADRRGALDGVKRRGKAKLKAWRSGGPALKGDGGSWEPRDDDQEHAALSPSRDADGDAAFADTTGYATEEMELRASTRTVVSEDVLEARVLEAFRNDPILRSRAVDIGAIGDGLVELTGWVFSADEVAHAMTIARGVPDVQHVIDRLSVRTSRR
jgi:osmotically-inducible protein OsmY